MVTDPRPGDGNRSPTERPLLDALFHPRSAVVYGASARRPDGLGNVLLRNMHGAPSTLDLVAVHPDAVELDGVPAQPSLCRPVDLALFSVPADAAPGAVADAADAGCPVGVVLSSGFAEAGERGRHLQHALVEAAGPMRLVGPNCMGVLSDMGGVWCNGSYFWDPPRRAGPVGLVSQSGAFGGMFLAEARRRDLGLARFVSVGNAADLTEIDFLEWLGSDPATQVVGMFIEGVGDGRRFVEVARAVSERKPVVVLKGAKHAAGKRAAASHTGTAAGSHAVFAAALRSAGVVEVGDSDSFFDTLAAMTSGQGTTAGVADRRRAGKQRTVSRVAIVTVSGGPGVLAADAAESAGVLVPPPSPKVERHLATLVPDFAALGNPFDFTPQCRPEHLSAAVRAVVEDDAFDAVVLIDCGLDRPELARGFVAATSARGVAATAFVLDAPATKSVLVEAGVPCLDSPERAVRALVASFSGPSVIAASSFGYANPLPDGSLEILSEWESKEILGQHLLRPREELTTSPAHAEAASRRIGGALVAKSSGVAHKSDAGLVRTGLDGAGVAACWEELAAAGDGRVIVSEEVDASLELVVGGVRDDTFGPVISIGLGGVATEVLADVCFVLPPVNRATLESAIQRLRGARLFDAFRGRRGVDRESLFGIVDAVSRLLEEHPDVVEVDCNPVMVAHGRPVVVDALVVRQV